MREKTEIRQLFERYRLGRCTPEEEARLHNWFNTYTDSEADGLEKLRVAFDESKPAVAVWRRQWLRYAAVLAVALILGWYLLENLNPDRPVGTLAVQSEDIEPGGNRATLLLGDGRQIDLNEAQSGIVVDAAHILYDDGGEELVNLEPDKPVQLVLSTPRGGTYQITLADGTKVWLNAASTLTYPSYFADNERVVRIDGEAYFAVAKDSRRPFRVISREQEIEVIGTAFNISAYNEEAEIKTTLVDGELRLGITGSDKQVSLLPGEQSILSGSYLSKHKVDTGPSTAWKDGYFHFENTPLADMMKQMARWYDVDVVYQGAVPDELFSGTMARSVTLQTVLELLRISEIGYRIIENELIIEKTRESITPKI